VPPEPTDLSGMTNEDILSVASYQSRVWDIYVTEDESKVYVLGDTPDRITQYNLTVAGDFTTRVYAGSVDIVALVGANTPFAFWIKPDGTSVFVLYGTKISELQIVTPYDITTCTISALQTFDTLLGGFTPQASSPRGLSLSPDGSKLYTISAGAVYQWTLTVPFTFSSHSQDTRTVVVGGTVIGLQVLADGAGLLTTNVAGTKIQYHATSTPFDSSTAVFENESNLSFAGGFATRGFYINNRHTGIYVNKSATSIAKYDL